MRISSPGDSEGHATAARSRAEDERGEEVRERDGKTYLNKSRKQVKQSPRENVGSQKGH